ncbi:hypothetical protein LCGC14_0693830 [marine sediment metagenome]|uniref:Uncharacterized protein n=1 Tax=marine sediment metagenome TaxID=412755 RepID=A0A0F9R533_9ZZZZ
MEYYKVKYNNTRSYAQMQDVATGRKVYVPYVHTTRIPIRFTKTVCRTASVAILYRRALLKRLAAWGINLMEL